MHRVNLSEAAAGELDDAYHWYERQRSGLGDELLEEFLHAIDRVAAEPQLYAVVERDIRRAPLHRFPYSLFYRLEERTVVVVAFFHGKREPVQWLTRR